MAAGTLPTIFSPPERFNIHTMNSCVIGTIELADQPIESLAPDHTPVARLSARIRPSTSLAAGGLMPLINEVIEADLSKIRRQLRYELCQMMRALEMLGHTRQTPK